MRNLIIFLPAACFVLMIFFTGVSFAEQSVRQAEQDLTLELRNVDNRGYLQMDTQPDAYFGDTAGVPTSVTVPDGRTVLLGGQTIQEDTKRESGVPVLSKIPLLNRLFRNDRSQKDDKNLIVYTKPAIVQPSEE